MVTWLFVLSILSCLLGFATITIDKIMGASLLTVCSILLVGSVTINMLNQILQKLKQ